MPSITTWTRIEARTRGEAMMEGLAARVHDPLWLLARQWQLGELRGEDTGTPVEVSLRVEAAAIDRFHPGLPGAEPSAHGRPVDLAREPLEAAAEREPLSFRTAPRLAFETGLHFARLMRAARLQHLVDGFVRAFAPPVGGIDAAADPVDALFARAVVARAADGFALHAALRASLGPAGTGPLPAAAGVSSADVAAVREVALRWLAWLEALVGSAALVPAASPESWTGPRVEYEFAVATRVGGAEQVLVADEHEGGRLDWWAFDRRQVRAPFGSTAASTAVGRRVLPTPVTFPGMPLPRFWEMEDARIDFGAIEGGADDVARMLLVEFALVFGNDWFLAPIDLPGGCLCRVESLLVTDTFGVRSLVPPPARPAGVPRWRMFALAGEGPNEDALFLPPVVARSLDGSARERVVLARDELANLAWAIEEAVESPTGRGRRRDEEPPVEAVPRPAGDYEVIWRARTDVAPHWLALEARPGGGAAQLSLRRLVDADGEEIAPRGIILGEALPFAVLEEEVPREGVRIERLWKMARWLGGRTVLWSARRSAVGRGPAASGLSFDVVERP